MVLFWDNLVAKLFDSLGLSYMMGAWPSKGALQDIFAGHWNWNILHILAAILGIMMLLRLFPKIGWIWR